MSQSESPWQHLAIYGSLAEAAAVSGIRITKNTKPAVDDGLTQIYLFGSYRIDVHADSTATLYGSTEMILAERAERFRKDEEELFDRRHWVTAG